MNFGTIKKWLLVGGQDLVLEAASYLTKKSQDFKIVTGQRNLDEVTNNGKKLIENFRLSKFSYHVSDDVNTDKFVRKYIDENTILLSLSSPWIFKEKFINLFKGKSINLHEANLPLNRGGATLSWMIMMSQKESASVLHFITPKIDEGDIVSYCNYVFPSNCKIPDDYMTFISKKSLSLIKDFIGKVISENEFTIKLQNNEESSYWPRLNTEIQGFIDWNWDAKSIEKFIDAFDSPYSGSRTFLKNKKVILKKAFYSESKKFHPFQRGIIYKKHKGNIHIACINGAIIVEEITDENNNKIFNNLKLGERFHTPIEFIEKGLNFRPVYSSKGLVEKDV